MLFWPYFVQKSTSHVGTKALNIHHQVKMGFHGISIGNPQHQKRCLIYVPHTRKIISSYDVVFGDIFYSALVYTSQPYAEDMAMWLAVTYMPYATSSG